MNKKRVLGIVLIILSIFFFILNIKSTGAVTGISAFISSNFLAIILLVFGIALFLFGLEKKSLDIVITSSFQNSIKKHKSELKRIEDAIDKIGTGLGNEEFLKHEKVWSIRTSHGGRVTYDRTSDKAILQKYLPPSKHY